MRRSRRPEPAAQTGDDTFPVPCCQRTKGASMKRILQRQQPPLSFMPVVVLRGSVRAGELQSAFPRFRAAIAKECFLKPRDLCEAFRKFGLKFVEEQIRNMDQPIRLPLEG